MSDDPVRYWFPAKRFGWGWGLPATWQGWIVYAAFGAAEFALAKQLMPGDPVRFGLGTLALVAVLVGICYVKGEPPAWRWGD